MEQYAISDTASARTVPAIPSQTAVAVTLAAEAVHWQKVLDINFQLLLRTKVLPITYYPYISLTTYYSVKEKQIRSQGAKKQQATSNFVLRPLSSLLLHFFFTSSSTSS